MKSPDLAKRVVNEREMQAMMQAMIDKNCALLYSFTDYRP